MIYSEIDTCANFCVITIESFRKLRTKLNKNSHFIDSNSAFIDLHDFQCQKEPDETVLVTAHRIFWQQLIVIFQIKHIDSIENII